MDAASFDPAMTARTYAPRVREDVGNGVESDVRDTPTAFINDVRNDGSSDLDTWLAAIERAA